MISEGTASAQRINDALTRPMPGAQRLDNIPALTAEISLMMSLLGVPLTGRQVAVLPLVMDALLFGEQQ